MRTPTIDHENKKIRLPKAFAKASGKYGSEEYKLLMKMKKVLPNYDVIVEEPKSRKPRDNYKGLTYQYMRNYIDIVEENAETRLAVHAEMDRMILISQCHSQTHRYPVIRKWFLDKYEEITKFGMPALATEEEASAVEEYSDTVMMPAKVNTNVESVLN